MQNQVHSDYYHWLLIQFGPNATEERQKHAIIQESNTKIAIICFRSVMALLVGKFCVQLDGNAKQQKGVDECSVSLRKCKWFVSIGGSLNHLVSEK